jgi:predicted transcriptional regulator
MKKLLFIMTFIMAVLVANAQISKVPVKSADLPKAITDNIAKNYSGFTVKEATKVTENKVVTYDVMISKGTTSETLVYDKDGKFLRKMPPPAAPTAAKPAATPAPAKK